MNTTELSKVLTSCLTAIKNLLIKYCETVYERESINIFWSRKHSSDSLNKLKSKDFKASKLSSFDFSTLCTTLPHHLIKYIFIVLTERTFLQKHALYLVCHKERASFHLR